METILIVDDTKTNINILLELLGDTYDVVVALDGKSALETVLEEKVDLILLDIMMPEMDGYEVCSILQNDSTYLASGIPIIFITAITDENDIEKAYDLGGSDYITKPFKPKELLAKVKRELQLKSTIQHLEFLSSHDMMTGIFNRRKFFELAENNLNQQKENMFALMIDIDKFKNINDNYGHPLGDKVIKLTASTISSHLNPNSIFGRLGGEEFAILTDFSSSNNVMELAEQLRVSIQELIVLLDDTTPIKFTISIGIAACKSSDSIDKLLKEADIALYEAKRNGRNKVILR